jgi:DNA-binding FadR family transcriptional regulator
VRGEHDKILPAIEAGDTDAARNAAAQNKGNAIPAH